jgi:hypothetical protein
MVSWTAAGAAPRRLRRRGDTHRGLEGERVFDQRIHCAVRGGRPMGRAAGDPVGCVAAIERNVSQPRARRSMTRAQCVMVLGTTSGAGKSWLTTALCRWYARQGLQGGAVQGAEHEQQRAGRAGRRDRQRPVFPGAGCPCRARCAHEPAAAQARRDTHSQVVLMGQVDAH